MKKIIKFTLVALVILFSLSLFGCSAIERLFLGGDPYSFSDIVMTQTGVNEYRIEFTANCGNDDVDVYFTEGFRLSDATEPKQVEKSVDGRKARFSFTEQLNLGEDYYLWLVYGDKEAKISLTVPSMFPSITENDDGSAVFNFNYTYGTAWGSFCDPTGKAVYKSDSPVFDSSASLLYDEIDITQENCLIAADVFDKDSYYYAVSVAKEGLVKTVSRPVMIYDDIISQIEGISAKITNDLLLQVDIAIPESAEIADLVEDELQLLVKTDVADEIYLGDCSYSDGVATMSIDCTDLLFDGLWYDVIITWRGAVVMDVPKSFNGVQVDTVSTVKKDGILYNIVDWKPDDAPESEAMLKVYFEEDTTRYADEICASYIVTFTIDPTPTLNVTVKFKDGISEPPSLAITGGDKVKLACTEGSLNDDGSYSYSLPVHEAFTEADKWYDLRFFIDNTAYEMLKDSCITYADYSNKYTDNTNARIYEFREYNGLLKLMYTDIAVSE